MKTKCLLLFSSVLFFIGPFSMVQAQQTPEKAAQQAAESWMRLIDSRKYGQAWDEASEHFKARVSKSAWETRLIDAANVMKEFGEVKPRHLVKAELINSLPSITNQEGAVLKYKSSFGGFKSIEERVELVLEKDGEWRVAIYSVAVNEVGGSPSLSALPLPPDSKTLERTAVDKEPILLNHPEPKYSEEARKNGIEGIVKARVLINTDGTVKQIKIIKGLPDGLNEEAIKTIYLLRYKPAIKNGKPVAYWIEVNIDFKLENK